MEISLCEVLLRQNVIVTTPVKKPIMDGREVCLPSRKHPGAWIGKSGLDEPPILIKHT